MLDTPGIPTDTELQTWAGAALAARREKTELVIRIVDETEIRMLNREYRRQDKPTNVLSFSLDLPSEVEVDLIGDLVVSAPVVAREAREQGKSLQAHWAHLIIHGVLHLQGFDHKDQGEAAIMESRERNLLKRLGFSDPY
ncbi:MAG: rRNA maturation RNase YbeY [Gammaproteobacteria bacterium]|nr:rRNA maturation RNase YbeY [Gammaproteobacteria bacterium]